MSLKGCTCLNFSQVYKGWIMKTFFTIFLSCYFISNVAFGSPNEIQLSDNQLSPLLNFFTPVQLKEFQDSILEDTPKENRSRVAEGKIITIDTRDQESCNLFVKKSNFNKEICKYNPESPIVSLIMLNDVTPEEFETRIGYDDLSDKQKKLGKTLRNVGIAGLGMMGIIYALPESVSKWDKSKLKSDFFSKYKKNIAAGPVVDKDDWAVNYIGHPVSGAAYYTLVRHQGFSKMESFAFSVCMSTFFWEYGMEAFAEIPSIQDLILTPVLGSLMGEFFYQVTQKISDDNGKLWGSEKAAAYVTAVIDSPTALSNAINSALDVKLITESSVDFIIKKQNRIDLNANQPDQTFMGVMYEFKF